MATDSGPSLCVFFVFVSILNPCYSQLCNNVTAPVGGKVTCTEDNTLLVCTAVCNKGYEFSTFTQVERRYCVQTTGQWVNGNKLPSCIPYVKNMCSSIEPPNQGVVRCENTNSQLVCNAKCNTGYMFESQELEVERTCDINNHLWINGREFPDCIRNDTRCSSPVAPTNGLVNCDRNTSTVHCVALCKSGYEFSTGDIFIERSCDLYNGSWNGVNVEYPKCVIKKTQSVGKCTSLPTQQHTSITCKHNGIDLICSAVCDKGYVFETNDVSVVRVCDDATGVWLNGRQVPNCVPPCNRYIISGNHKIGNDAFSASSIFNTAQLVAGAERVRIETINQNTSINVQIGGGWRPAVDNLNQFIQIDVGIKMEFYGIVTRGRDASNDYVKRFRVLYSSDGRHFIPYGDDKVQDRFFEGNSDSGSFVTNKFSCPFEARYVRVNPLEWNQHIGLRLDLLGCGLHEGGQSTVSTTTQASISSQINTNKISGLSTVPTTSSISPPTMCLPLLPPVNGIVNCEQSEKQLVCSALCKDGFVFESGEAFIKRSCDTVTGSWKTGTTYPDCKVYKGTLTTSPVNKLPHKCVGRVADCKILPNGDFQTCGDCHFYASCSEGYIYVRPCPVSLVFDSIAQRCLYTSSTCIHKPPIIGRR